MAGPPLPPQAPADASLTRSELLPIGSTRINILRSRALLPFMLTGLASVGLFVAYFETRKFDATLYMNVLAAFLVLMMFLAFYLFSGERKNILFYLFPAFLTVAQLAFVFPYYYIVTRQYLPGDTEKASRDFPGQFVSNVFGPGLSEEFLKAGALFVALAVAAVLRWTGRRGNRFVRGFALEGPIDGMLMGVAAGGAFILVETMLQYVPNAVRAGSSPAAGAASGLMLLVPRVLNGVVGHMAYAGIVGYFAGLAATHPRATFRLLALGLVLASVLHGFWNSAAYLHRAWGLLASAALTGTIFFSCFMKARQLEASRLGIPVGSRSILALSPQVAVGPALPPGIVPPRQTGVAGAASALASAIERSIGVTARTSAAAPGSAALNEVPPTGLSIEIDGPRYALAPDRVVDFSTLFAAAGVPPGTTGTITAAPDGGLLIRNTGVTTWVAFGLDGAGATIMPGADLRPVEGTRLVLGDATVSVHSY